MRLARSFPDHVISKEALEAEFARELKGEDTGRRAYIIEEKSSRKPVGWATIRIHQFQRRMTAADVGLALGERTVWNKGYGTETAKRPLAIYRARSEKATDIEHPRTEGPEGRHRIGTLSRTIPRREGLRYLNGERSENRRTLQSCPRLQALAGNSRSRKSDSRIRRSPDRYEGQRGERSRNSPREGLRENGEPSHGRQDTTVQVTCNQYKTPIVSRVIF